MDSSEGKGYANVEVDKVEGGRWAAIEASIQPVKETTEQIKLVKNSAYSGSGLNPKHDFAEITICP